MLTVDYDKLGLQPGHHLLDLGCGFGRHAFEALRRGAHVTACDMSVPELMEVQKVAGVLYDEGEVPEGITASSVNGDATLAGGPWVLRRKWDGVWPSDHYPVVADFRLDAPTQ